MWNEYFFMIMRNNEPLVEGEDILIGKELNKLTPYVFKPIIRFFTDQEEAFKFLEIIKNLDGETAGYVVRRVNWVDVLEMKEEASKVVELSSCRFVLSYFDGEWPVNVDVGSTSLIN